ncbi:hypothetical protein HMPREF0262_01935 [Clostridium sp. ATCC 29733]|nr:hypothetical protein HMPREF0262_01935 [Clostridium sp. ATCC 29733]
MLQSILTGLPPFASLGRLPETPLFYHYTATVHRRAIHPAATGMVLKNFFSHPLDLAPTS